MMATSHEVELLTSLSLSLSLFSSFPSPLQLPSIFSLHSPSFLLCHSVYVTSECKDTPKTSDGLTFQPSKLKKRYMYVRTYVLYIVEFPNKKHYWDLGIVKERDILFSEA